MTALLRQKEPEGVARFCHCHVQSVVVQADGYGHVRTGDILRNEGEGFGVRLVAAKVCDGHPEEFRQRVHEVSLLEDAHLDEELAEPPAGCCLQFQCLLNLCMRDETAQNEHVTELLTGPAGRRRE